MPRRTAFLVGNQVFRPDSGLLPLRGPGNDVAALSRLLGDPTMGGFTVREFLDKPRHEILPEMEQTLNRAKPGDLVLIYYSGHGKLDRNGRVCLATADTREGALQATSIPARHLTDLVNQSDCDQVVLLLDCCYSGAVDDLRGDLSSEMRVLEDAQGFYILTASTERQTAREEASLGATAMGRFTTAIVQGIESGDADIGRKGKVMLSDLRQYIGQRASGQTPQFFARRAIGDPLISESPGTALSLLDPKIAGDLTAESWHHRAGAVSYLVNTIRTGIPAASQAARAMLERRLLDERDVDVRKQIAEGLSSPASPQSSVVPPIATAETPSRPATTKAKRKKSFLGALGILSVIIISFVSTQLFNRKNEPARSDSTVAPPVQTTLAPALVPPQQSQHPDNEKAPSHEEEVRQAEALAAPINASQDKDFLLRACRDYVGRFSAATLGPVGSSYPASLNSALDKCLVVYPHGVDFTK